MRKLSLLVGVVTAACLWLFGAGAALAGPGTGTGGGESTGGGYAVSVSVTFSGDAAPGGGGSTSVSVPPTCWWEPIDANISLGDPPVDTTDPESVYEWYQSVLPYLRGHASAGNYAFPDSQYFLDIIAREAAGEDYTWYHATCRDGADEEFGARCFDVPYEYGSRACQTYSAFQTAAGPPPPLIDPEDLAEAARDAMVIDDPQVDRNPKVAALGASTFVGLPTWFWVENAEAALGVDGTKFIRAAADGTGVWAEVTAQTDGLRISSPAGDVSCSSERATTPWAPGTPEAAGCSLGFRRASVGYASGFPVEASTAWTATWSGSDGTVGATLPGTTRQTPFNVPVAESQAIVSHTR